MKQNKKQIYFHGTSADNLESILLHGISCNETKLWNCSNDEIYLWSPDKLLNIGEVDDYESGLEMAFRMANASPQIACIASKDCRMVVLKIELNPAEVYPDESCENMKGRGAVCIERTITIDEIVEIKVSNDFTMLKGYFIATMLENEYFSVELSRLEMKIAEAFKKAEIYPDDIDDLTEWEIHEFKNKLISV